MPSFAPFDAALLRPHVPLAPRTSMQVGGPARLGVELDDAPAQLPGLMAYAQREHLALQVLGQGSNVVIADGGLDGIVVWLKSTQVSLRDERGGVLVRADAGADFSTLCAMTVREGLMGLAALSGIPGTAGAAPLQNIGAYGQSLGDVLVAVETVEVPTGAVRRMQASELGLGYRTSHFKGAWRGRFVITAIELFLPRGATAPPPHAQLMQALGASKAAPGPSEVAHAVLALRRDKGMLWQPSGALVPPFHAGSFFTNPIVDEASAVAIGARLGRVPQWPDARGVKLSAAFLIEAAGFVRGWRDERFGGRVGLSPRHALALANFGGASAHEVAAAAQHIQAGVLGHSGVTLVPEPTWLGFA